MAKLGQVTSPLTGKTMNVFSPGMWLGLVIGGAVALAGFKLAQSLFGTLLGFAPRVLQGPFSGSGLMPKAPEAPSGAQFEVY